MHTVGHNLVANLEPGLNFILKRVNIRSDFRPFHFFASNPFTLWLNIFSD